MPTEFELVTESLFQYFCKVVNAMNIQYGKKCQSYHVFVFCVDHTLHYMQGFPRLLVHVVLYGYLSCLLLQELIQNAEDAKATEVKFLLDETQHESRAKYLHHAELVDYQVCTSMSRFKLMQCEKRLGKTSDSRYLS